jgi:hypothetical protein
MLTADLKSPVQMAHPAEWKRLVTRMAAAELESIKQEINRRIDASDNDVQVAGWIPGHDWTGTPFMPLYEVCGDTEYAGLMFGLIVWAVMMERPDHWSFGRYPVNGREIQSMQYFRIGDFTKQLP